MLAKILGETFVCPWNHPHFLGNSDKSLLSPKQNKLTEICDTVCTQKTAEDNNAKINISLNITCTFLLFKASAFLQILFLRNFTFPISLENASFSQ